MPGSRDPTAAPTAAPPSSKTTAQGRSTTAPASGGTQQTGFSRPTTITYCDTGHPTRARATAFFVVGTVQNTSTETESYTVWIAFRDGANELMYYTNASVDSVRAGETKAWEVPAVLGTTPHTCAVPASMTSRILGGRRW